MPGALPASIVEALLGWHLGPAGQDASNRFVLEGLSLGAERDGMREIGLKKFEAVSLLLAATACTIEIARLTLHGLQGQLRLHGGKPHLSALQVAEVGLPGAKAMGPLAFPQPREVVTTGAARSGAWALGPLAAADGVIQAQIVDAHLLFDADVRVPVRQGRIDFDEATVEHVGPDSRMGVSRLGLYVDAPNGRSYLYQFAAAAVAGVDYERRGAMLAPRVSSRGSLQLQPFLEGLLRQGARAQGPGFTDPARQLLGRTALRGEMQLGDGRFAAPGVQAEFTGRAAGRNAVRLHSEAVGRGVAMELASFALQQVLLGSQAHALASDSVTGALLLRLTVEGGQLRFALELADVKASGLRLQAAGALPA